jgi:pyruvate kinase
LNLPIDVIVTAPPYADFLEEIVCNPLVSGLRLNTVMPVKGGPQDALERLSNLGKPLWVDLKGRQLRVVGGAVPPFTEVRISHRIRVDTPADVFFSDGSDRGRIVAVDGDRLILADGPRRMIGPGESVNIPHASLEVEGVLTGNDRLYLEAMPAFGLKQVMLSYVEAASDVEAVRALLPDAELILKIESRRGLAFARRNGNRCGRLAAARGDLFVELTRPHQLPQAMEEVIRADPAAIAASRIFDGMAREPVPSSAEIGDFALLLRQGYRTFMLGDAVCLRGDVLKETLNLIGEMGKAYTD